MDQALESLQNSPEQAGEQQATTGGSDAMQATLGAQILQLREEMRSGLSAIQAKVEDLAGGAEDRAEELRAAIEAESRITRQQTRALHEELIVRIRMNGGRATL